jgi:multiple antibiotic resistance protein
MYRLADIFIIFFITLGPLKMIPVFFMLTRDDDRPMLRALALRSALVATVIVCFTAFVVRAIAQNWRVSTEAILIVAGLLLFMSATKALLQFSLGDGTASAGGTGESAPEPPHGADSLRWLGKPVLSPLAIPSIVTPIGIAAILVFMGTTGTAASEFAVLGLLLAVMLLNVLGMLWARAIVHFVGIPVLQVVGWLLAVVQAGLGIQAVIDALRMLLAA